MSFGFGVSDFITIGKLLWKLREDYAAAPADGRNLEECVTSLQGSLGGYSQEDSGRLEATMRPILELLQEIEAVSERYSNLDASKTRVWDRITFPKAKILAMHKQMHLRVSAVNLFMHGLSNRSLAGIEEALGEIGRVPGQQPPNENNWNNIVMDLQRRGIEREDAVRYRSDIETHLLALSEFQEAESQLQEYENTIVPDDALDQDIVVGPPTAAHLVSSVCPGASLLQEGKPSIKQSTSLILRHFGGAKFKLSCTHCKFHGFQDEPFRPNNGQVYTPIFFFYRLEPLKPSLLEYHFDIYRKKGTKDGIYYRTIFFWKCHVKAKKPALHTAGRYECVFCPPENISGTTFSRDNLLEHIRRHHVQTPPSQELRIKYNVWIHDRSALFPGEEERINTRNFDLMIPRAHGRTDRMRAQFAMGEYEREEEEERERRAQLEAELRHRDQERAERERQEQERKEQENKKEAVELLHMELVKALNSGVGSAEGSSRGQEITELPTEVETIPKLRTEEDPIAEARKEIRTKPPTKKIDVPHISFVNHDTPPGNPPGHPPRDQLGNAIGSIEEQRIRKLKVEELQLKAARSFMDYQRSSSASAASKPPHHSKGDNRGLEKSKSSSALLNGSAGPSRHKLHPSASTSSGILQGQDDEDLYNG
ncbi:hypothetical protein B0J14DRAFT_45305 [Halenospora varia]|nr:hypothetical protein B0J14DRAFT_45305 [Halenospora varia]